MKDKLKENELDKITGGVTIPEFDYPIEIEDEFQEGEPIFDPDNDPDIAIPYEPDIPNPYEREEF